MISNSGWKEYTANTNYAFQAFETKDKKHHVNGGKKNNNHHDHEVNKPEHGTSVHPNHPRVSRHQTRPSSVINQQLETYPGDTRSLQKPKVPYPSTSMPRTTFSLPRTAYDRNQRSGESPELQPDFYFMPSQRKYSGEVVTVYVDYNNQGKK